MDYRHEAQPRRPGRDVARLRVEPAADRVRSTRLQVGYVESARPRKGSSTMSTVSQSRLHVNVFTILKDKQVV